MVRSGTAKALEQTIREICLELPETVEKETWGHPTFRIRDKIFVGFGTSEEGVSTVSMKAPPGVQEALLDEGHPFFYPKYVGPKGWIGVVIDVDSDWDRVTDLIDDSFREIAPKTLVKKWDGRRDL